MYLLGFKARVGSLICTWWRPMCYMLSDICRWCDTCWPLGDQYGSQTILFYIPVSKYWWGSKPGPITDQADADEFKLYFNRYAQYSVFQHVRSSCRLFCRIWKSEKVAALIIYSPFSTESTHWKLYQELKIYICNSKLEIGKSAMCWKLFVRCHISSFKWFHCFAQNQQFHKIYLFTSSSILWHKGSSASI